MEKKRELTWEDLFKGNEEVGKLFDSMDYSEGRFLIEGGINVGGVFLKCYEKESMLGVAKGEPIIERKVSANPEQISRLEVCAFAREVYDILMSKELDESEIMAISWVKEGIREWDNVRKDLDLLGRFFSSYKAVSERRSSLLAPDLFSLVVSEDARKRAIKILDEESEKLKVGGTIRIDGVKNLRSLGLRANLGGVFSYTGYIYCTMYPETHGFKRDLERAVQYEMLTA